LGRVASKWLSCAFAADAPRDIFGDALFQALEKAGLKLEKSKAPIATIIIDHLEKTPTEN
jgi:uncharacterized protein (TIGR03435 family)